MNNAYQQNEVNYVHYKDPLVIRKSAEPFITSFSNVQQDIIAICIGTDRSTGDSLGPLTGTFLSRFRPKNIHVYGTLHHPVHAINLEDYLREINNTFSNPFTIAVDASLGNHSSIGYLISGIGSLQPGAALNKTLPPVGDMYLTGVVNIGGFMDYSVLQSTRLSIVHDMAYKLALILSRYDHWITRYKNNQLRNNLDTNDPHPI